MENIKLRFALCICYFVLCYIYNEFALNHLFITMVVGYMTMGMIINALQNNG